MPVPVLWFWLLSSLLLEKRSNSTLRFSIGMPIPSSFTIIITYPGFSSTITLMLLPAGVNLNALLSRLNRMVSTRPLSIHTVLSLACFSTVKLICLSYASFLKFAHVSSTMAPKLLFCTFSRILLFCILRKSSN